MGATVWFCLFAGRLAGILHSDGVNTYTYDPANKLSMVNGTTEYIYNGLGDRLQQTVGSQQTNYVLDLNSGLTQVLEDGTNTYLYGNECISQTSGTDTQYFLGDALGSVRQMTDVNGAITLAKAYDPYGVAVQSIGSGSTSYGFSGEQADANGLIYLRARYYSSDTGRFLSRDTWNGDANQPMSFNRWNYVEANPVNFTDPSGLCSYSNPGANAAEVESHVHNLSKSYWLDTYTAAGLAVQCWAAGWDWRPGNDSWGPAQVSDKQTDTPYGEGDAHDGLRCYVLRFGGVTQCFTPDQLKNCPDFDQVFQLEPPLNPLDWNDAATLMQRRIKHAIDTCNGCGDTDRYIIAAMAQNGPGFTSAKDVTKLPEGKRTEDLTRNWDLYYYHSLQRGKQINTSDQLSRFRGAIKGFEARGWSILVVADAKITDLINNKFDPALLVP